MALSDDQKAMLKLVSQPDTSYEDIAALMGLSVEDVRAKVDAALAELDQGDANTEAAPAPVVAAEDAAPAEEVAEDAVPEPEAPKAEPKAKKPAKPRPAAAKPKPASGPSRTSGSGPQLKLPKDRGAFWGLVAGVAAVVVLVLVLVTGVLGGGDDDSGSNTSSSGSAAALAEGKTGNAANTPEPTGAILEPVDGGDASGRAVFARSGKNVLLLLSASGLEASPKGQSYTVSLTKASDERVPLIATKVGASGKIGGQFQVAAQVLGLLASGYDQMEVSLVPDDELATALKTAQQSKKAPSYSGTDLLRGPVTGPIVEGQGG